MRVKILVLTIVVFFALIAAGQAAPQKRHVIAGTNLDYIPYTYLDDKGKPAGFFIELTQAVGQVMNLDIEFRIGPWHEIRSALEKGELDVICGMSYSRERSKFAEFSPVCVNVSHCIFTRKGLPQIENEEQLRGKKIIVVRGNIMHDYLLERGISKDPILVDTQAEALRILVSGKGDYALGAQLAGFYWIKKLKLPNIVTTGPLLPPSKYCFAFKKGNSELLEVFNEGITILKEVNQYERIYSKWFLASEKHVLLRAVLKQAVFVLVPLAVFLILAGLILWSKTLKIQVAQKTAQLKEEIKERKKAEEALQGIKEELEIKFAQRTSELEDKFRKLDRNRRAMLYLAEDLNMQSKRISEAKEYSDNIIKSIIDMLIVISSDAKIEAVNRATIELLGYSEDELIGKDLSLILPGPEEKEPSFKEAGLRKLIKEGFIRDYYLVYKSKSGEKIPLSFSGSAMKDREGRITGIVGIARDIREIKRLMQKEQELAIATIEIELRKKIEEALRDSEERLKKTQEMAHLGSWELDLINNRLTWSDEVFRIFGLKPQEFGSTYEAFLELVHPDDRASVNEAYSGSIRDGKDAYEIEHRLVRKDSGEIRIVYEKCQHLRDTLGRVIRSIGMVHDITEPKRAEAALRRSEALLSATLNSAGDGIIVTSTLGYVLLMNPVAEQLTGWKEGEVQGLPLGSFFNIINEVSGRKADDPVARVIREGNIVGLGNHTVLITREGTNRPIDDSAAPIRDANGKFIGVVLIFRDVTERRRTEKKLQEAILAKSAFTSMVSHELRTPLGALKESVSLLSEGMLGEVNQEQKKFLDIAKNNVDRLARLINEVLDFQTLETGKMAFKMQPGDINETVKEVRATMLPLAEKKNLDFVLNLDAGLPKIQFDRDKMNQVLSNLINNSIKLTEKGGITVTTSFKGNIIQISVKDTGPGIKEEDLSRLFQEYEQLERRSGGTGLGLAISMEIIKAHGGKIWAESKFGEGTTFHFILPIKEKRGG